MNEVLEWTGTICGIAGAALIASNVRLSPWGWWLFLISSLALTCYGVLIGAYGIMSLNICFVLTNCLGIARVWVPHMRKRPLGASTRGKATAS
ncbi:nicotinamide mononucleotide transporter [Pseudomonas tritici]|uniref:nicotinamide mononucleotide transporter n=1 Tax=Pseudomonas tritici TaxID=2745518 RepID=UPI00387A8BDC